MERENIDLTEGFQYCFFKTEFKDVLQRIESENATLTINHDQRTPQDLFHFKSLYIIKDYQYLKI